MTNSKRPAATIKWVGIDGRKYKLTGDWFRIGRDEKSNVHLLDDVVSANHAAIFLGADGSYWLEDLRSTNSTKLEGQTLAPNRAVQLHNGSKIRIAKKFDLVFHLESVAVRAEEDDASTVVMSVSDLSSVYLAMQSRQPTKAFQSVLDVNRALSGSADLDEMLGRVLDRLMLVFPRAERGFIMTGHAGDGLRLRAVRQTSSPRRPPILSRSVCRLVLGEGQALRITDGDRLSREHESAVRDLRAAICAPLPGHDGRPVGMVQLDSSDVRAAFTDEDLELLAALAIPIGAAVENHNLIKEQSFWTVVEGISQAILPQARPVVLGYSFWHAYQPVQAVGGDLYDYIAVRPPQAGARSNDPRWNVIVGDVTGHGITAAFLMAYLCPEIRHLAQRGLCPEDTIAGVNRRLCECDFDTRFVTLALAELDTRSHRIAVVNGGHPDVLVRRAGGSIDVVGSEGRGPTLGVLPDLDYHSESVPLDPGDIVVMVTDGVIEAPDPTGNDRFGIERLRRVIAEAPASVAELGTAIAAAVRGHVSGCPPADDITIVCFGRNTP